MLPCKVKAKHPLPFNQDEGFYIYPSPGPSPLRWEGDKLSAIPVSYKTKILLAKKFRKNMTNSEKILWQALRRKQFLGLKVRRQFLINGYIADFYCYEYRIIIEVDGEIHKYKKEYDKKREKNIQSKGINIFRISSMEVEKNINKVLIKLKKYITNLPSPRRWRGAGGEEKNYGK